MSGIERQKERNRCVGYRDRGCVCGIERHRERVCVWDRETNRERGCVWDREIQRERV